MFTGHYAVAFAAAPRRDAPGLGTLFIGVQVLDLAFFSFLPLGVERMRVQPGYTAMNPMDLYSMPFTHSLVGALGWSLAFGLLLRLSLVRWTPAFIGGAAVFSHWLLDLLVHAPDLTLMGRPPRFGLGLWNHPAIEMPLEMGLLFAGAWFYARRTRPIRRRWALSALLLFLVALQAINWFGPPPISPTAFSFWGVALLAYLAAAAVARWVGRNRKGELPRSEPDERRATSGISAGRR